jgi:hypothetical protein
MGEWIYIAKPYLTTALDGGEWCASVSDLFTPGNRPQYSLDRSWAGLYGEEKDFLPPQGIERRSSSP